jgi:hypothetical protein
MTAAVISICISIPILICAVLKSAAALRKKVRQSSVSRRTAYTRRRAVPWVTDEQLAEARKVDLLTYLREREPQELVRSAPGEYRTASHGSLVISKGVWYWNQGQVGGRSALDYLVKVRGYSLAEAVDTVSGVRSAYAFSSLPVKSQEPMCGDRPLTFPPRVKYPTQLLSYLQSRGILADVIRRCLDDGILYEGLYPVTDTHRLSLGGTSDAAIISFLERNP